MELLVHYSCMHATLSVLVLCHPASMQRNEHCFVNFQKIAAIHAYTLFATEKYFDMNKKSCKEGLDIYKKFITRMDRVSDFLKVAEDVGFDKDDIPDLSKVTKPQLLFTVCAYVFF